MFDGGGLNILIYSLATHGLLHKHTLDVLFLLSYPLAALVIFTLLRCLQAVRFACSCRTCKGSSLQPLALLTM